MNQNIAPVFRRRGRVSHTHVGVDDKARPGLADSGRFHGSSRILLFLGIQFKPGVKMAVLLALVRDDTHF